MTEITPPTGHYGVEGQPVGMLVMKSVLVNHRRPLEWIAERAGYSVAFRGYWAVHQDEDNPKGTPVDVTGALATGLERMCSRIDDGSLAHALDHEQMIIREFRRRAHHYMPGVSLAEQGLELIALMQHHGAPTRLLDWTYSLYVAAHFALGHASRRPDADLAIWTIRPDWCRNASRAACTGIASSAADLWAPPEEPGRDLKAGVSLLSGKLPPSVWPVNPFRLNERLTIQQGLFLAPGDVSKRFLLNLGLLPGASEAGLTRYVIPRSKSLDVARSLYEMNVTQTTLFPGLDGFAESLWFLPEIQRQRGEPTR